MYWLLLGGTIVLNSVWVMQPWAQSRPFWLSKLLPEGCAIIVGGRSASAYTATLRKINAIQVNTIEGLFPVLDKLQLAKKSKAAPGSK